MKFSLAVALAAASAVAVDAAPWSSEYGGKDPGLNKLAQRAGKMYFGSASDNYEFLQDAPYREILSNRSEFGQSTPGNLLKWYSVEPQRDVFNFTGGDQFLAFTKKNGQYMRGHCLVWHSQLADWVNAGNWTRAELLKIMKNHITTVVSHYKGKGLIAWDVVNEAFNEDGTFRETIFYNTIGEDYIEIAFRTAAAADPHVNLFYNDYNLEGESPMKSDAVTKFVNKLKRKGVKIDGIGAQSHFVLGGIPSNITATFRQLASTGAQVALTEIDIRMPVPANSSAYEQQRKDYYQVTKACLDVHKCVGMTVWDYTDKYSWVPGVFPGVGDPLIFDWALQKKPAYYGIQDALLGR